MKALRLTAFFIGLGSLSLSARGAVLAIADGPKPLDATLQAGQALYQQHCAACHGVNGDGNGPASVWLFPRPRNFSAGLFKIKSTPGTALPTDEDLLNTVGRGMPGSSMPSFTYLPISERRELVGYIKYLTAYTDPSGQRINRFEEGERNGQRVAIHCAWRDSVPDGAPVRVQDFQDAAAVQFSMNGATPFLGMGDTNNPVNIWQWKAGWQQEAEGQRPDMAEPYPSMHADTYFATSYRTALEAGNLVSMPHRSPVEDANARGFGTLQSQPPSGQNVQGKGIWRDGSWSVIFIRELKSPDADDVTFSVGKPTPVAFAVWDGQNRDRNGRKVISNWHRLVLEP
jgi:mono/diheme cytochrome c family protein